MPRHKEPEQIELTQSEAKALSSRIESCSLTEADKSLMIGMISFSLWLQNQLSLARLSIKKLKSLFGVNTEKKSLR